MKFSTGPAPHSVAPISVRKIMLTVLAALAPAIAAHWMWFGPGILVQIVLAVGSALTSECFALKLRGKSIVRFATDGSAILTGTLLALALPPLAPWWLAVSGAAFAILVAKQLYGGLGYNLFNPAMVGYAALLVSFPAQMNHWLAPSGVAAVEPTFGQTLAAIFSSRLPESLNWDVLSGATPLASVRAGLTLRATMEEIHAQPTFGSIGGVGWEWVSGGALLGGLALLAMKVIRWHIPVAMLAGIFVPAMLLHALDPGAYSGPIFQIFSGAALLGAFFIATDPVSAATSNQGRLIYGAGIGILTYVIRVYGGYPDGVAFAVLLMNAAVPLIDRYTVPRIYGHAE